MNQLTQLFKRGITSRAQTSRCRVRPAIRNGCGAIKVFVAAFVLLNVLGADATRAQGYRKPTQAVLDVLNAPVTPTASISPTRDRVLLTTSVRYPPIADLAQPMLRLAGLRINPNTNGQHRAPYFIALTLKRIDNNAEIKIDLPRGAQGGNLRWSADGKRFAFTNTTPTGIELWTGDASDGKIRQVKNAQVSQIYGEALQWMPDNRTLLVQLVPANRARLAPAPNVPTEPNIQESSGNAAPVRTYQDLLKSSYDETQFEYYATAQLALIDSSNGKQTNLGAPAIFETLQPAPDGKHLLISRIHRPFSFLNPVSDFPKDVEVWDTGGKMIYRLASLPLADRVPIEGVPVGARSYTWRPNEPATLLWVEALDEGDPKKSVPFRDRVLTLKAPFTAQPVEVFKTQHRYFGTRFGAHGGMALVGDYERNTRRSRTMMINLDGTNDSQKPDVIWSFNIQDRYNDPGRTLFRTLPTGHTVLVQNGDTLFLVGEGASPEGDRPFLDRYDLKTRKSERVFRSDSKSYETVVALLDETGKSFLTRYETPINPSNYFVHQDGQSGARALTDFADPTPQLRGIKKQLVTYKRKDGVQCSFTLYLPPGYKEGTRLPTVVWAYPLEFNDAATAGQVSGSLQRFTTITGYSHLFFLLNGYAVLDDTTMPVVGDPETVNNNYVDQIVMSAEAAIDEAVKMGVTDRDRVGVGGHSYGAFMTANLLAHSDLFRAGIARSGAYNRTLTPFGFQSERRSLWEAPEMYSKVSPFMYANKIKEPILMIHGEADNNTGTFPIQSERMYQAIRGNGGTVRLVLLPLEAHGYAARESTEHVIYEMLNWFDKYVKNAAPRTNSAPVATN